MHRKFASGAQKRKVAAEKKQKQDEALKKVPKINEMFSVVGSSSNITESQSKTQENVTEDDCEINADSAAATEKDAENENMEDESGVTREDDETMDFSDEDIAFDEFASNVSASSHFRGIESRNSSQPELLFSTDVALWDIQGEISSLQRYWTKSGRVFFSLYGFSIYFDFTTCVNTELLLVVSFAFTEIP